MKYFKNIYLTRWFFVAYVAVIILYVTAYAFPFLSNVANVVLASLAGLTLLDVLLVFSSKQPLTVRRTIMPRLNLGEENPVTLAVENNTQQPISFTLIEGYPVEMQERSKSYVATLMPGYGKTFTYLFTPKERGEFVFGNVYIRLRSVFFLISRKIELPLEQTVRVYPSVLQMKKYELLVFKQQRTSTGIKRIRRLGNASEFEQIKNYVQGDEIRKINWKATSRKNELQVNQYQEERSQHVYCIIDKSKSMEMDFKGLSMLDYAINSTLVFSNIALKKGDKAGLITYADKIGTTLAAERSGGQMRRIQEALYNQKSLFNESNFELLYNTIRRTIKTRSLLVLFTNFETVFAMRRALPMLRRLNQKHVLVVVFFQNAELQELAYQPVQNSQEMYQAIVAEKMIGVKSSIARELRQNGIHTILSLPEELSVNT
ncbi:MAG: DUF58 domain-containing protein, partial [Crocinitomicaceae bacterium]